MTTKHSSPASSPAGAARSSATARAQRNAQRQQDSSDRSATVSAKSRAAVQAGPRRQPVRLPRQHLKKPALEADLALAPRFLAPDYAGSGKLAGKVALVTGGDSGIGRAVAVLFAREGADVAIVYLNEDEDARATEQAIVQEGRRCLRIPGDVRKPAFCRRAVATTIRKLGALDVLVNNAAFQEHAATIESLSESRFDLTLKTNVYGYFNMAKAAVPHLPAGASIINTGSVTGLEGEPQLLDYATTKGAIHAFTKSLASQLLPHHIRVNAVAPGPVWTALNPSDKQAHQIPTFGQDTDMKRAAQPEEISPAYVFLASGICSSYVSGIVLPITGSVGGI